MTSLHTLLKGSMVGCNRACLKDHAPNGLQVEGRDLISRLALGVTASADVIDQSIAWGADALLVHHGYFWERESPVLTGIKGQRVRKLIQNQISLLVYHLPLDCHPEFGNNKTLLDVVLDHAKPIEGENGLLWSTLLVQIKQLICLLNV